MEEQIQAAQEALPSLISAVEVTLSPMTPPEQRRLAYETCEQFKETSPLCVQCGVLLSAREQPNIVRHFGLQLLEHSVKFRWYKITQEERLFIKENTMKLMKEGTQDILVEELHIKDGVSRIVVEMMKREWPQQWPNLLEELSAVSAEGPTQTELVLLVLLRVVEDVVSFRNMPAQRNKDMHSALTTSMEQIFTFFLVQLYSHTEQYKAKLQEENTSEAQAHCKVAQAVLNALCAYVEWVNMSHIMHENGKLLQILCVLLSDDNLQLLAAECLSIITSRKGKPSERRPLLILFSEDAMSTILSAAVNAASRALSEHHYQFLKKLCQVLTSLGTQLLSLWIPDGDVGQPEYFMKYLDAILAFAGHPSQCLGSYTCSLLTSFMKHELISVDPVFQAVIPQIIEKTKVSLTKVGYPSQNNHPSCEYSRLESDSDEEFGAFFSKWRCEMLGLLRQTTRLCPDKTFKAATDWLQDRLRREAVPEEGEFCNLSSTAYLEWEALSVFMESVMTQLQTLESDASRTEDGVKLLDAILQYETHDALILSCVLSCVSALFAYIHSCPDKLSAVLTKIFSAAQFTVKGQTKATRSRAVKNVRRHACCCLVKICKTHPDLLLPGFEELYSHIKQLSSDPEQLSQMEKTTFFEALILISNRFNDFQKQSDFIGEIMQPVKESFQSEVLKEALWSVEKLLTFVGVDQAPVEPSDADTCGINRSQISYCLNTIVAVIKRSQWPSDPELIRSGGFSVTTAEGATVMRNPALPHVGTLFDSLLALLRSFNMIWQPQMLKKRHPEFTKAYDMVEAEKQTILGVPPSFVDNSDSTICRNPIERMQNFFTSTFELGCHFLGNIGASFGHEFYAVPNLAASLVNSVLFGLEHIPNYRLRPIIRTVMKPYIQNCPKELYKTAVIPVLKELLPYMHQHLVTRWHNYNSEKIQDIEDQNPEAQEVVEDQLLRLLTRDFMELLGSITLARPGAVGAAAPGGGTAAATTGNQPGDEEMTPAVEEGDAAAGGGAAPGRDVKLSELGALLLKDDDLLSTLVQIEFAGLNWDDTQVCNKCVQLVWPVIKQVVDRRLVGGEDACHLMTGILLGLVRHGRHDGLQSMLITLAANTYTLLRPIHPEVASVMLQSPNCSANKLTSFDEQILTVTPAKQPSEKKRKESFRRLVADIIGKDIGQQFKKNAEIKDLPPLWRKKRRRDAANAADKPEALGICALFDSNNGDS